MEEILRLAAKIKGSMYQVQYVDFGPDEWTSPCLITEDRIKHLLPDHSIRFVRVIIPS